MNLLEKVFCFWLNYLANIKPNLASITVGVSVLILFYFLPDFKNQIRISLEPLYIFFVTICIFYTNDNDDNKEWLYNVKSFWYTNIERGILEWK